MIQDSCTPKDFSAAVILGCGYTGERVARILTANGIPVIATARDPSRLRMEGVELVQFEVTAPFDLRFVPERATVLISIPTLPDGDPTPLIVEKLGGRPRRVVYLSTTGVYGETSVVDECTPPAPNESRSSARVQAEDAVRCGPWHSLILRPAAIYGPGRGVHARMLAGSWTLPGDGNNYVSRIHVEDLARIAGAAMLRKDVTGAYPVADTQPSTALEITQFCADLLGLPMPQSQPSNSVHPTRRSDRRVNGAAILHRLSLELLYPSYRVGVPASLGSV